MDWGCGGISIINGHRYQRARTCTGGQMWIGTGPWGKKETYIIPLTIKNLNF